ncbi:GNAT family N-acetyltransferase [Kineococcus sp. SYSU DK003]|uniref:GNAT family N-acetyltransferase n=1 Tax=Kineococcus sp. SYSU DK003 TaxID=3383124 RepID=UPI003D7EBF7C
MQHRTVRPATTADAAACAGIYAHYVRETAVTFELDPPTEQEVARRIEASWRQHAWLVLTEDDVVRGYAYAAPYAARAAYAWSCETSVYLEPGLRRSGAGRALYQELFATLERRGFRMLVAGITQPNEASTGLHRAMGFTDVGTFTRIGFKLGRWWDVHRMQRPLGPRTAPGPLL